MNHQLDSNVRVHRVPSDVLYSLNKEMPKSHIIRKFSSIQKRMKTLNDCASKWEKDVASILRKHSRSALVEKRKMVDTRETFSKEEYEKIVAMSKCDFLSKVNRSFL